ncbi:hypothetical protein BV20DRAFT_981935 [Pilatotrama ljubarskyi]|nr:hypothetical protein BV20DRAFT_981935 [Pilatotrama ljubarskyi]
MAQADSRCVCATVAGTIGVLISMYSLIVDLENDLSHFIRINTVRKLVKDSTEQSALLTARLEVTKLIVKAHAAGELPVTDPNVEKWFLLCRQQLLQNTALFSSCRALTKYVYRMHKAMAAQGMPAVIDPLPQALIEATVQNATYRSQPALTQRWDHCTVFSLVRAKGG